MVSSGIVYENFSTAKAVAKNAISEIDISLTKNFLKVLEFCFKYPEDAGGISGLTKFSARWIQVKAKNFATERNAKPPKVTELVSDPLIQKICNLYFKVENVDSLILHHKYGMAAEQVTGSLLEEYIASQIEPIGWIWCTGKLIKATDFIKFPKSLSSRPVLLQIKNRSNSENSSSAAIRQGTDIIEWHRMDAESGETNWEKFPNISTNISLTESDFHNFVKAKIANWRVIN